MKTNTMALSALAMLCGAAAWAGKPEQFPYGPLKVTGEKAADCGDFLVLTDYSAGGYLRLYLAKGGWIERLLIDLDVPQSSYYNSEDPSYWLPGTAEHIQQWCHSNENEELINWVTTGDFTLIAGQFDQFGNCDAICAALRP